MAWGKSKRAKNPTTATTFTPTQTGPGPGLDALVTGLFDYAGMYPPANLPLDEAVKESARSTRLRRPQMVGADLVVGVEDLGRLDEGRLRSGGFGDTECKVAVVGIDLNHLDEAVIDVAAKNADLAGVLRVVSLEVHGTSVPSTALATAATALPRVQVYLEPRMPDTAWAQNASGVLRLLRGLGTGGHRVGLKVRASGKTAVSPGTLGLLIPQVVAAGIPFKATAGLHHPLVEERHGNEFGFLGLAAAFRLRQALGDAFAASHVQQCVAERDPGAFSFSHGLAWREHAIALDELADARRRQPFAIGSCSLREPDDDLARLYG